MNLIKSLTSNWLIQTFRLLLPLRLSLCGWSEVGDVHLQINKISKCVEVVFRFW